MRQWGEEVESQAAGCLAGREGSPVAGCKAGSGLHPASGRLTVTLQGVQSQAPRNAGGGRVFGLRKTRLGWSASSRERGTKGGALILTSQETLGLLALHPLGCQCM